MTDRLKKLENLVETLRGPNGCPWDREQRLSDLRAYVLEEAHELAAAIDQGDPIEIREELGDLLFQIVFIARLLAVDGRHSELDGIVDAVHRKMVDRHPHVFGGESLDDSEAVRRAWEARKVDRGNTTLGGVPNTLPALLAAYRVSQKAAGAGFDWPDVSSVLGQVREELAEVELAIESRLGTAAVEEEVGDLLLATANLARKIGFDPEAALQQANSKFRRRFEAMEARLDAGETLAQRTDDQLEDLWRRAKKDTAPASGD